MPRTNKGKRKPIKKPLKARNKKCIFTEQKIEYIDYKDVEVLKRFISTYSGKIQPRRNTGVSAKQQRKLASAIKLSREAGFLPFII